MIVSMAGSGVRVCMCGAPGAKRRIRDADPSPCIFEGDAPSWTDCTGACQDFHNPVINPPKTYLLQAAYGFLTSLLSSESDGIGPDEAGEIASSVLEAMLHVVHQNRTPNLHATGSVSHAKPLLQHPHPLPLLHRECISTRAHPQPRRRLTYPNLESCVHIPRIDPSSL